MNTVLASVVVAAIVSAGVAWFVASSAAQRFATAAPPPASDVRNARPVENHGPNARMALTQEEYLELKLNLECVAMGGICSAVVVDSAGRPYILPS